MLEIMDPYLSDRTTLRLGGKAIAELIPESMEDIKNLSSRIKQLGGKPFFIGQGSNILARDGELPVVLVRPRLKSRLEIWARRENKFFIKASAHLPMAKVQGFCLKYGFSGFEGLVGIPGSVGGAVRMNAGSYGAETAQILHSVLVWNGKGLTLINQQDMEYGYRYIHFTTMNESPLILEAIFTLTASLKSVIFKRTNLNFCNKKSGQPLKSWSAGCAFKNPSGALSAGQLLDKAGFRGKSKGGMAFSRMHANFLINEGNGSSQAAFELLEEARERVSAQFGINLELEIKVIE